MTPDLEALADLSISVVSREAVHTKATAALATAQAARDAVAGRLAQAQAHQREVGARRVASKVTSAKTMRWNWACWPPTSSAWKTCSRGATP